MKKKDKKLSLIEAFVANKELNAALEKLFKKKPKDKSLIKACEELSELSVELLQELTKPKSSSALRTADEMVDVAMNLALISKYIDRHVNWEPIIQKKYIKMINGKGYTAYVNK